MSYILLFYITLYNTVSYYMIQFISYDTILYHMTHYNSVSNDMISYDKMVLYNIIWSDTTLHYHIN